MTLEFVPLQMRGNHENDCIAGILFSILFRINRNSRLRDAKLADLNAIHNDFLLR